MRGAIGANALMDGGIVAVVHDEFRGMGFEDLRGFMEGGGTVCKV